MYNYDIVSEQVRRAQLQRNAYVVELITESIIAVVDWAKIIPNHVFSVAGMLLQGAQSRARNPRHLFTFDV